MNKEQLKRRKEELEIELASIEKELSKPDKLELWEPEEDNYYWYVTDTGDAIERLWRADPLDCDRLHSGNCYQTKEEAERDAKLFLAQRRYQRLADIANDGRYEFTCNLENWYIYFNNTRNGFCYDYNLMYETSNVYFKSQEAAQQVLDNLTDDEKILLFEGK